MVNLSKKGTQFCPVEEIPRVSAAISVLRRIIFFMGLQEMILSLHWWIFINEPAELHPFREGNGRTQRVFFCHS